MYRDGSLDSYVTDFDAIESKPLTPDDLARYRDWAWENIGMDEWEWNGFVESYELIRDPLDDKVICDE